MTLLSATPYIYQKCVNNIRYVITNLSNNPSQGSGGDESDFCEPVGGGAIEGVRLRPPTGGAGDGHDGAGGAAAGIGLDPLEHVGG